MALVVKKFGGSSVATTEKILNVAKRVLEDKKPDDKIVVDVSAMGDTTDDLISLAEGIDDRKNCERIKECGCDYVQGNLYGKAMPAEEATRLHENRSVMTTEIV